MKEKPKNPDITQHSSLGKSSPTPFPFTIKNSQNGNMFIRGSNHMGVMPGMPAYFRPTILGIDTSVPSNLEQRPNGSMLIRGSTQRNHHMGVMPGISVTARPAYIPHDTNIDIEKTCFKKGSESLSILNFNGAIQHFKRGLDANPISLRCLLGLSKCLIKKDEDEDEDEDEHDLFFIRLSKINLEKVYPVSKEEKKSKEALGINISCLQLLKIMRENKADPYSLKAYINQVIQKHPSCVFLKKHYAKITLITALSLDDDHELKIIESYLKEYLEEMQKDFEASLKKVLRDFESSHSKEMQDFETSHLKEMSKDLEASHLYELCLALQKNNYDAALLEINRSLEYLGSNQYLPLRELQIKILRKMLTVESVDQREVLEAKLDRAIFLKKYYEITFRMIDLNLDDDHNLEMVGIQLKKCIEEMPGNFEVSHLYVLCLWLQKNYDTALLKINRSLENLDANQSSPFHELKMKILKKILGVASISIDQREELEAELERSTAIITMTQTQEKKSMEIERATFAFKEFESSHFNKKKNLNQREAKLNKQIAALEKELQQIKSDQEIIDNCYNEEKNKYQKSVESIHKKYENLKKRKRNTENEDEVYFPFIKKARREEKEEISPTMEAIEPPNTFPISLSFLWKAVEVMEKKENDDHLSSGEAANNTENDVEKVHQAQI